MVGTVSEFFDEMEDMGAEPREVVKRLGGEKELYLGFLREFTHDKCIEKLRVAISQNDSMAAFEAVHALKGVSLNLGLLPLADCCSDMVMEYRKGNVEQGNALFSETERSFRQMCDLINQLETIKRA
ncbi:MAG: Hpt domain-containing protein [Sphaerochaetaceae bacterium]|nr:Hpt domain-containing protein [Sphaerochaetaceae bacterium]